MKKMNSKKRKKQSVNPPLEYVAQRYERFHKTLSLKEVLPFISKDGRRREKNYYGNKVKMFSLRLRTFALHGTCCVTCGICGEFFALEKHLSTSHYEDKQRYHFNLYARNKEGEEVLLTKDHILPKSKGGADSLDNMQPMCIICNNKKGDNLP